MCTTYESIVTLDDSVMSSGTFNIVLTNKSNKHIKVTKGHTMGMLKTCEEDKICTIHRAVTFEQKPVKEKEVDFNTFLKKDLSPVTHINELGPQTHFISYNKPAQ